MSDCEKCPLCGEEVPVSLIARVGNWLDGKRLHQLDTRNEMIRCPHAELWAKIDNRRIVR